MKFFKLLKEFGFKFAVKYLFYAISIKLTNSEKSKTKRNKLIDNFLRSKYLNLLPQDCEIKIVDKDFVVWVFWYQGYEQMPKIVKVCIDSIKQNFKNNKVILITKENYQEYADIPDYITEKVKKGIITLTHFSDILRATLLAKHGGIWIDSTVYLKGDISQEVVNYPFYTLKLEDHTLDTQCITRTRWAGFLMSGARGNPVFVGLRDILFEYWKDHNVLVNYFLIDYIINFLYDNVSEVKDLIDKVPMGNKNLFSLAELLFEKFDETKFAKICQDTKAFKLTYKFSEKEAKLKGTFYQELIK